MKREKNTYNLSSGEVLKKNNTSHQGLSDEEVEIRLKQHGPNKIEKKQNWKWLKIIFSQFNDALVWILLVAASLAFIFGELRDMAIILIIVFINASIGFFQEFRAERILESLKKLATNKALVFRKGIKKEINAKFIVPGDIIYVSAGDNIPADGYILESYSFKVNSFTFTGESKPELKSAKVIKDRNVPLADIDNMVFMGETVATGEARFAVTGTGMNTELGKIATLTQVAKEESTPLQRQMRRLGKDVTILAVFIGILVLIAGQYFRMSWYDNFLFALALSVSVVPEGLPAAISVALSLGMKRLLKKNVLAKKLNAVETLGSVEIICTDKTGTITRNELAVTQAVVNGAVIDISGEGYKPEGEFTVGGRVINPAGNKNLDLLFKIGTLCNDASLTEENGRYKIIGDPTEGAIIVAGKKFNPKDKHFEIGEKKINENPFSSERMMMSVIYRNNKTISYVKGSPDVMIKLCAHKIVNDEITDFTESDKIKASEIYNQMSEKALRVLAFAYRDLENIAEKDYLEEAEKDLIWVGMMAMIDPPRADVGKALAECRNLGINVIMITGDYEITARAIAEQVGLIKKNSLVINGKTLDNLNDKEIYDSIKNGVCVFARIAPEQKLRIADILKNNQQIIAMTGDGVNDAPALRRADIGVAMGIMGTDVSKEASDMILLNDDFSSIVNGIKEGRTIFQNLKKFVHYVLTSNASELFSVLIGVLLQVPFPITAIQILSIDLATDVFPSFSLSFEAEEPGERNKKMANAKQGIMTWQGFRRIIYLGIIMAACGVFAFLWSMLRGGWHFGENIAGDTALYVKSTTATYAVLAMTQMANLLQSRSEKLSPFKLGFFKNKYVIGAIFISLGILIMFMYLPFCQKYLHMLPIDNTDWIVVAVSFVIVFLWEEARKGENK
jgi:Ca2+-transporting ATPase